MTPAAKAIRKIALSLGVRRAGEIAAVRRTRAGRHQRAAGAWSWLAVDKEGAEVVGSQWSIAEVVLAHHCNQVVTYRADWDLVPEFVVEGICPGS